MPLKTDLALPMTTGGKFPAPTVTFRRTYSDAQIRGDIFRGLSAWADNAIKQHIRPITPMDTGELRKTLAYEVQISGNDASVVFSAGPCGGAWLEVPEVAARVRHFTTEGTEAPFLSPGVQRAIEADLPEFLWERGMDP